MLDTMRDMTYSSSISRLTISTGPVCYAALTAIASANAVFPTPGLAPMMTSFPPRKPPVILSNIGMPSLQRFLSFPLSSPSTNLISAYPLETDCYADPSA